MKDLTGIGKEILITEADRIRLDQSVKKILAYKPLLARIFKQTVSECGEMSLQEIEACIEGEIAISQELVDPGFSNAGERIEGLENEVYFNGEGLNRYDILNAILINISGKHDTGGTDNELIRMMTDLFDERLDGIEKIEKLEEYGIELTQEIDEEVTMMCSYATAMENKGMEKGMEKGLKALVISLKEYISEFDALYSAVKKNEEYAGVSREEVLKYYK